MGVIEILMIDDVLREMIINRISSDEIKKYAIKNKGMIAIWDDAVKKFSMGLTTLEEIMRIAFEEE